MKPKNLVILIILLILAGLVFGFVYWSKNVKPGAEKETVIPSDRPAFIPKLEELKKFERTNMINGGTFVSPPVEAGE